MSLWSDPEHLLDWLDHVQGAVERSRVASQHRHHRADLTYISAAASQSVNSINNEL